MPPLILAQTNPIVSAWTSFFAADPKHLHGFAYKLVFGLIVSLAVLVLLQFMPPQFRKNAIRFATFLGGLYYALEWFIPTHATKAGGPQNFLSPYLTVVGNFAINVGAFAIGLGSISLLMFHVRNISRRREHWGNSIALMIAYVSILVFDLLHNYVPKLQIVAPVQNVWQRVTADDVFNFLFKGGLQNLNATMFGIIGFFIVSASYRAFRIRSFESSLLMVAALLVMLGEVTLGVGLTNALPTHGDLSHFRLENIAIYILLQINTPALRAISFGIAIGFLATSLRLWLSLERGAYFDTDA